MKKFLITKIFLLFLCFPLKAETVTVKCHVDENKSFSFIIDKEKKEVLWLDEDNQKMSITIFPDIDKGARTLIMGGTNKESEKFTFIIDLQKAMLNVISNLGYKSAGKCGNKSIYKFKDKYE